MGKVEHENHISSGSNIRAKHVRSCFLICVPSMYHQMCHYFKISEDCNATNSIQIPEQDSNVFSL
jgi:hypothetical protein